MENQLQEVKNQFTKELFEAIYQEVITNGNEDLFSYYNLIISNLYRHNTILKDISDNGLAYITYINEDMGYTDGDIIISLNNKTEYRIKLIWKENMIGDYYENEECILTHEYRITHINTIQTITEENTDNTILHKIKADTEDRLRNFRLQQKQDKLNKMLEERKQLELDIEELKKELALAS
ncbi:hypothetical protein CF086_17640 [Clostridium botulinum]|uniref:hypothetical protein n=1 Tax=Clostridium botulinum TaxID=1491 RepID=UPI00077387AB|nr:hypothetical protein [Clostridium botulinum]MBN3352122.1 hypothetical protein [Clostridium botulinum]